MTNTARIPSAEITGVYGALVKTFSRRMFGRVPDSMGYMWHNTRVLKDSMAFGQKVHKWNRLDPDLASYATIATAAFVGCSFCVDLNYFLAHNEGLDTAKAREVPRWRESDVFTPLERRVMEYAEAMSQTPSAVTDELVEALLQDLDPASLLELTSRVGFMNATARSNVALGIRSEEFADSCGLAPIAAPGPVTA
ncbi:carboxymuconolactone decarboxylase family protein [Nocardioides sp.]|uniref:carboxymuconolactone decarboxylase family protein n=1 Tax=Nocardioides sp. TaxID=35761 RepID=UPI002ED3ED78